MLGGLFTTLTIIVVASIYIPSMTSWRIVVVNFGASNTSNGVFLQVLFLVRFLLTVCFS